MELKIPDCPKPKAYKLCLPDSVNATYNPIEINAGSGTKGIYINQGVIKYNNPTSGGFYGR